MPLINKIEVAHFLNIDRKAWRPIWPHAVFDLMGQNTIINMPNGKGKTTIVNTILFCLAGMGRNINEVRNIHFAPKSSGNFSHVRVQVILDTEEAAGNDLFTNVPQGQQMVFGVYGRSGDNEQYHLYAYHGTLEDCPVHKASAGFSRRIELLSDSEFLEKLHGMPNRFPSSAREKSVEAWKAYIARFFDMANLSQQIGYQLKSGAEGDSNYFDVKVPKHMSYSSGVFYEHLAPQLLPEVMGSYGEEDEWGIEDTIHEKARQVIHARFNSENNRKQLDQTRRVLEDFQRLDSNADELDAANKELNTHKEGLAAEFAVLKDIVVDRPIPGLPPRPPEDMAEIARYLVLYEGVPYFPDRAFHIFTGEEPKRINERALRHNIPPSEVADKSQLIEITCDQKNIRDERGRDSKFYDREGVTSLLRRTETFLPDVNRDSAIKAVEAAFAWALEQADTNPARLKKNVLELDIKAKMAERDDAIVIVQTLSKEKTRLITEQQEVGEQQAEYRRMQRSGAFSPEELAAPEWTGRQTADEVKTAELSLKEHERCVARREEVHLNFQKFIEQYGPDSNPEEILQELITAESTAREKNVVLQERRGTYARKRSALQSEVRNVRDAHNALKGRLDDASESMHQALYFDKIFPGEAPKGLEQQVVAELKAAGEEIHRLEKARSRLANAVEDIRVFRERFGASVPGQWLADLTRQYDESRSTRDRENAELQEARTGLDNLEKYSLAPEKYARAVADEVGVSFQPLHKVVEDMALVPGRKEQVLTLFSALLFAPVVATLDLAVLAAQNLADKKIEFPVFIAEEFEIFCQQGDISCDGEVAKSLFVGIRTRSVKCLLDPTLVEEEKKAYRDRIAYLTEAITRLEENIERFSPNTDVARLAARASEAVKNDVLEQDAGFENELAKVSAKLPRLQARNEAIESIRAAVRHRKALDGITFTELQDRVSRAGGLSEAAERDNCANDQLLEAIDNEIESAANELNNASVAKTRDEQILLKISDFIKDKTFGLEFMVKAAETQKTLSRTLDASRLRNGFRFDLAQLFVKSGNKRPQEIELRLAEIDREIPILDGKRDLLNKSIEDNRELVIYLQKSVMNIDILAHDLVKIYRKHKHVEITGEAKIDRHSLYISCQYARNSTSEDECIKRLMRLRDEAKELGDRISELSANVNKATNTYQTASRYYNEQIERISGDETLKIPQHIRISLEQAKSDYSIIKTLLATTQKNFHHDKEVNETASQELEREWGNMAGWLSEFTQRLPTFLRLMKNVFAPKIDPATKMITHAGFEISGDIVRFDDIEGVMEEIIHDIEEYEEDRHRHRDSETRKGLHKDFRKGIRDKFYQKVISHPSIKVAVPSISPTPFLMESPKKMVSSGQGVAISILWIVKLADFVSERERQRKTVGIGNVRTSMKKARTIESQFVFVDGAFSHLSDQKLIDDALHGVMRTRGSLQLIVTGHDPEYRHNYSYFPTFICGREIDLSRRYMYVENKKTVEPGTLGSHYGAVELMRVRSVPKTPAEGEPNGPTAN
jgi:hypothetical protein